MVRNSDEALICLGLDWLKNVLFNEPTMEIREVLQQAIAKARTETAGLEQFRESKHSKVIAAEAKKSEQRRNE